MDHLTEESQENDGDNRIVLYSCNSQSTIPYIPSWLYFGCRVRAMSIFTLVSALDLDQSGALEEAELCKAVSIEVKEADGTTFTVVQPIENFYLKQQFSDLPRIKSMEEIAYFTTLKQLIIAMIRRSVCDKKCSEKVWGKTLTLPICCAKLMVHR